MLRFAASERGIKNLTPITWKNIVSDYGATSGGSGTNTGDYTAFKAFHDWAIQETDWVGLTLPPTPGSYYGTNGNYSSPLVNTPFLGIKKLIVMGYGAALSSMHGGALLNNNTKRAAIYSVDAGSSVVQLKSVGDASKYTVGTMALIAGLDLQGFGYPPNPHCFDWRRITAISGDLITLDEPLTNDYKDDWPRYFEGSAFEVGGFGPATICGTIAQWDCEQRIFGVTSMQSGQTYTFVRKSYLFDVKTAGQGFIAGASVDHRIVNQDHTGTNNEVDKLSTYALYGEYDGVGKNIHTQSSSPAFMHVRGGTRSVDGTPRRALIEGGSSPTVKAGPLAYGHADSLVIRNHVFNAFSTAPSWAQTLGTNVFYEGDGVFRYVGTDPMVWLVPGACGVIATNTPFYQHSPFRITRLWSDGGAVNDDVLFETTLTGGSLPTISGQTNISIAHLPMTDLTVENCTGCPAALELSMAGANKPYGTYANRTFAGLNNSDTSFGFLLGRLVSMKINVLTAYTGAQSTFKMQLGGQFGGYYLKSDMTTIRPTIAINLKIAGERVITPGGVTGTQTGDTNLSSLTGGIWMPQNTGFNLNFGNGANIDISGEAAGVRPVVTIEVLTDQEIA